LSKNGIIGSVLIFRYEEKRGEVAWRGRVVDGGVLLCNFLTVK